MSDLPRHARIQQQLHKIFPLYAFIQLTVDAVGGTVRCSAPFTAQNTNHFGVMHAGILFSLAEATAGIVVTQHRPFARLSIIARHVAIDYLRKARTAATAIATLDDAGVERLAAALAADPKHTFDVPVDVQDEAACSVARCVCTFQLRATG